MQLINDVLAAGVDKDVLININFPDCEPSEVAGQMVTTQGRRDQGLLKIDSRTDPRGRDYFWFDFERRLSRPEKGTDLWAIYNGYISITPLHLNLTHFESCVELGQLLNKN